MAYEDIRPDYYNTSSLYEPWKIIDALKLDFYIGNALKYMLRAGKKNEHTKINDIDKAITYLKHVRDTWEAELANNATITDVTPIYYDTPHR